MRLLIFLLLFTVQIETSAHVVSQQRTKISTQTMQSQQFNSDIIELKKQVALLQHQQKEQNSKFAELRRTHNIALDFVIVIFLFAIALALYVLAYKRDILNSIEKSFDTLGSDIFIRFDGGHRLRDNFYEFIVNKNNDEIRNAIKDILHEISINDTKQAGILLDNLPSYFIASVEHKNVLKQTIRLFTDNMVFFIGLRKRNDGETLYKKYLNTLILLIEKLSELESE